MHKLANFSVETDTVVLLQFQNGEQSRVATPQLSQYLSAADLKRVQAALKLRRDFLKTHLPKMGLMLAAGVGLAALFIGGHKLAAEFLVPHQAPVAAPLHEDVAQMVVPTNTPETTSAPNPAAKDAVTPAKPKPSLALAHHVVHSTRRTATKPLEPVKLQLSVPAAGPNFELPTPPLTNLLSLAPAELQSVVAPVEDATPASADQSAIAPDATLSVDSGDSAQ